MKIVINDCYGGFGLSKAQMELLGVEYSHQGEEFRTDQRLIKSVEDGDNKTSFAYLIVCEIPDGADYKIHEYDGLETLYWSLTPITIYASPDA